MAWSAIRLAAVSALVLALGAPVTAAPPAPAGESSAECGSDVPPLPRPRPRVLGFCEREPISRTIRRSSRKVRRCYVDRLKTDPNIEGRLKVRFLIAMDGRVEELEVEDSTLNDETVTQCVLDVIRKLEFPSPAGGTCRVNYPFEFKKN